MLHVSITGDLDFLQAKVHGLRSRVYEFDRLDGLCDLRTITQLWHRLYPEADPADHHALERRLLADQVAVLEVLRSHLPEPLVPFFTWVLRRFQVENLKVLLRAWKAHEPPERVAPFLAPLPAEFALPAQALLKAATLADFLLVVPVRELRSAGEKAAAHQVETGETFFIETAFDAAYYNGLITHQQQLTGEHGRGTEKLVRLEVAAYNVLCLFRVKLSYSIPYEQARELLVKHAPHPFRLERIYDFPDFTDMLKLVPRELLPREGAEGIRNVADLERALWERLLQVANRQFYRSAADLGGIVAFATIKRVELANLIRAIEGVRYGLAPEDIRKGLIRVQRPAT